jgi:RHS repeat-associated protein
LRVVPGSGDSESWFDDFKVTIKSGTTENIYVADVKDYTDYYAFGGRMPGRFLTDGTYRYGFNGKEKDDEIKGSGNSYDFGLRIYDPRIGKFLSIDPLWKEYEDWSPYVFAGNNPIRYVDIMGAGPGDRVKKARSMVGIPYSQEGNENGMRTSDTKEALAFMDCSEFVCRVLHADGITKKVEHINASGLKSFLSNEEMFEHSMTPEVGDIAVWDGHVGIVTSVDENGKFKLAHARGKGKLSSENGYHINASQYRTSKFHGFYRPKVENPDGGNKTTATTTTTTTTTQKQSVNKFNPLKALIVPFKIMNDLRKAGEKVADDFKEKVGSNTNNGQN